MEPDAVSQLGGHRRNLDPDRYVRVGKVFRLPRLMDGSSNPR